MRRSFSCHILPMLGMAAALAACDSAAEEPDLVAEAEVAQPEPVLTSAATPTAAADGTALVPGAWAVTEDANGPVAAYAEEGLSPFLQLSCPRGDFAVTMFVATDATEPQSWRLDAGGEAARIDLAPTTQPGIGLSAAVDQGLGIINALSAEGQSFVLTSPDGQRWQYPTHPGILRVIDACRFASN